MYDACYSRAYEAGAKFVEPVEPTRLLVGLISDRRIPTGARVIEFACGEGRDSIFLAKKGFMVLGTDSSKWAIRRAQERAREEGVKLDFGVRDLDRLDDLKDETFDLAVNIDSMSFVTDDVARERHFQGAFRILKTRGIYFLCSHYARRESRGRNEGSLVITSTKGERVRFLIPRVGYLNRTKEGLEKEITRAGFRILSSKTTKTSPIPALCA